jgi:hypothetical protein
MLTEPKRCNLCAAPNPGNPEGTLCRQCVQDMAATEHDAARERAIDRAVDEHLDREREKRHGL